jgi:hypothetical protein
VRERAARGRHCSVARALTSDDSEGNAVAGAAAAVKTIVSTPTALNASIDPSVHAKGVQVAINSILDVTVL